MKWKTFKNNNNLYMIKVDRTNDGSLKTYLTDLITLWTESQSRENILNNFKRNNPSLVDEYDPICAQLFGLIQRLDSANVTLETEENVVHLTLESQVESPVDFIKAPSLKYNFHLEKSTDNSQLVSLVTIPMIQTIQLLEKQRKGLVAIVQAKDKALEWYALENGPLSRDDLVTEKFQIEQLKNNSDKILIDVFNSNTPFGQLLDEKFGETKSNLEVPEEPKWKSTSKVRKVHNETTRQRRCGANIIYNKNKNNKE